MVDLIVCIIVVFVIANFSRLGAFRKILSSDPLRPWRVLAGGILAWAVVGFAAWAIYEGYLMLEGVFTAPFSFMAAVNFIKFLAIILGITYLHQMVVQLAEAGSTEVLYRKFLRMLFFERPHLERGDIFEKAEQRARERALSEELERRRAWERDKPPDPDHEKHFGGGNG